MDRNSLIGLFIIGIILIVFSLYNTPSKEEQEHMKRQQDSIAALKTKAIDSVSQVNNYNNNQESTADSVSFSTDTPSSDSTKTAALVNKYGLFAEAATGNEEFYTIENELLKLTFTNKGGRIYRAELKKYKTYDSLPLVLLDGPANQFSYQFFTNNLSIATQDLYFQKINVDPGKDQTTITFRLYTGQQKFIEQKFTLSSNSYLIDYQLNLVGLDEIIPKNSNFIGLNWTTKTKKQEKSLDYEQRNTTIYYKYANEKPDYLTETKDAEEKLTTSVEWISFKQQFFNQSLIARKKFDEGNIKTHIEDHATTSTTEKNNVHLTISDEGVKTLSANLIIPYNHQKDFSFPMQWYMGPNHYQTLKSLDNDLEKIIPLGWALFRWVNRFAIIPTFNFLNQYIANYGVIILILTILLKVILFPLNYKSFLSMAKMNVLKPEMEELKSKYGNDQQKISAETMKLYQKAGVNPLGGCLPTVLSLPILIAMYIFFPSSIELRQESFLWAKDLSTYDSIWDFGYVPLINTIYGNHVSLFTLLMTITSIIYAHYNMQMSASMNPQMKWMQYIFPIMLLGVFNQLPAALTYYYFLTNVLSFAQQYLIKKYFIDEQTIRRKIDENKKKPVKKSRFQEKLEELTKAQSQNKKKR